MLEYATRPLALSGGIGRLSLLTLVLKNHTTYRSQLVGVGERRRLLAALVRPFRVFLSLATKKDGPPGEHDTVCVCTRRAPAKRC